MWVRSQDKKQLYNIQGIVSYNNIITVYVTDITREVARYRDSEQCNQVLDEIQERINEGCPYVYEMPEDEPIKFDDGLLEYAKQKREEAEEAIKKFKEGL